VGEINTQFSSHLYTMLSWVSLLMINLAIFNMMPLFPLDGENFIYALLKERLKRGFKGARILINSIFLALIVLNIGLSFIKYGLTLI